jgi:eukaryotic-like serine/threonine-protein kinase
MAHWVAVSGPTFFTSILPAANFGSSGPVARGHGGALQRFGTMNLAGNVKDIAHDRIGYLGQSRGAAISPITLALDDRIKAAVLMIPGFYFARPAPEVDVFNFAPRVRQPVLILSGRYDYIFPEQRSQLPFFERLGTPAPQKRRVAYDSGHNLPANEMIRETLDWFDRYLGPVQR